MDDAVNVSSLRCVVEVPSRVRAGERSDNPLAAHAAGSDPARGAKSSLNQLGLPNATGG
jgi:hypothetical protein